jgi:hypothetical protein
MNEDAKAEIERRKGQMSGNMQETCTSFCVSLQHCGLKSKLNQFEVESLVWLKGIHDSWVVTLGK